MHLHKLEISGFKSFPHRTELLFDEGMMGVVGPNGCGKTNILDSIRWVLGEQRPTMLRSSRIDEVLFNGTADMAPADLAEVNLVIKNTRGILPIEYSDVVITRRLYRSGESEYLINKTPCRLKDILSLFADTGMGTHAYSVFQTSMIDAILSDNAEERRFLFEEAAGITKYKAQKKEAIKKLESTQTDMLRLGDIIGEISKNVRSLQRQAGRAKRHKTLKDRLAELEAIRASAQLFDLRQREKILREKFAELRAAREAQAAKIDKAEAAAIGARMEIAAIEERLNETLAAIAETNAAILKLENELALTQNAMIVGQEKAALWRKENAAIAERKAALISEMSKTEISLKETSSLLEQNNDRLLETEAEMIRAKDEMESARRALENNREHLRSIENELLVKTTRLEALKTTISGLVSARKRSLESMAEIRKKVDDSRSGIEDRSIRMTECDSAISEIEAKIGENQQTQLRLLRDIENIRSRAAGIQAELAAAEGKADLLAQLIVQHEGYGSGVKAIFAWENRPEGVIDTLANLITTGKEYRAALEAAANRFGQLIVCKERSQVEECIQYLQTTNLGRAGFISLDIATKLDRPVPNHRGWRCLGPLAAFITADESIGPLIELLFGSVLVFAAGEIPADFPGEAVDLAGKFHSGAITEGGVFSTGIIGRKGDLRFWQDSAEKLRRSLEAETAQIKTAERELDICRSISQQLQDKKRNLQLIREKMKAELSRIEFEFKDGTNMLERLASDQKQAGERLDALRNEAAEIEKSVSDHESARSRLMLELNKNSEQYKLLAAGFQQLQESFNNQRIRQVELSGLTKKLQDDLRRQAELIAESDRVFELNESRIQNVAMEKELLEKKQAEIRERNVLLLKERDGLEKKRDELLNGKNAAAFSFGELENGLKKDRGEMNARNEELHRLEMQIAEIENQAKNIEDSIFHDYEIKITDSRPENYDEVKISADIMRLRRVVDRLGPVNMLAFEEYEAERDRLRFLEAQMKDLEEAKASLLEAIQKINQTAREKFTATFEQIRKNFQSVFETLFEGGTTELKLTDPDDVLESPIEIIARPGNKKLMSLSQLSGGERALTAISLLFGIYLVKPSPFCILDEIDAPLDDANVNRFVKLLDRFKSSTQFIVITHNKKTMEAANILYGVTMDRPGISSIVSVKFEKDRLEKAVV